MSVTGEAHLHLVHVSAQRGAAGTEAARGPPTPGSATSSRSVSVRSLSAVKHLQHDTRSGLSPGLSPGLTGSGPGPGLLSLCSGLLRPVVSDTEAHQCRGIRLSCRCAPDGGGAGRKQTEQSRTAPSATCPEHTGTSCRDFQNKSVSVLRE